MRPPAPPSFTSDQRPLGWDPPLELALRSVLKEVFGHEGLRQGQAQGIASAIGGRDSVILLPTGSGKSLCYQLPAIYFARQGRGPTLVISPLIALMDDQVRALQDKGIAAAALHSGIPYPEQRELMARLPQLAMLYVSPERLKLARFRGKLKALDIPFAAVDEAHCIALWGHDFRPDYQRLSWLKEELAIPVMALSATAPPRVREELERSLCLKDPSRVQGDFRRQNLSFSVEHIKGHKARALRAIELLKAAKIPGRSGRGRGVIYCSTRKRAKAVWDQLKGAGITAGYYHGGRSDGARVKAAADFASGKRRVIVATQAFGMGIDLPDVRLVCHVETPASLEAYYQEAGRAGRDGAPSQCVLLYSDADPLTQARIGARRSWPGATAGFDAVMSYVHSRDCRQVGLLTHLTGEGGQGCGRCDVCVDISQVEASLKELQGVRRARAKERSVKLRTEAEWELSAEDYDEIVAFVDALSKPMSAPRVAKGLRGSRGKDILRKKLNLNPHFGALKGVPEAVLRRGIAQLLKEGRLAPRGQKYPTLWIPDKPVRPKSSKPRGKAKVSGPRDGLKTALRNLRKREASRRRWKAYQVFSNQTMEGILAARPMDEAALLAVPGMGPKRVERFGVAILKLVREKTKA